MKAATLHHPGHGAIEDLVRLGFACMWLTVFWALLYFVSPTADVPVRDDPSNRDRFFAQPTLSGGCDYHYASWPVCDYGPASAPTDYQPSPNTEMPDFHSLVTVH